MQLTEQEKKEFLKLARKTIEDKILGRSNIEVNTQSPIFQEISGAFVTLHKKGELRGCIGNIVGIYPLVKTIKEMAIASAFQDPRFEPLTKNEYPEIDIEITILSPLKEAVPDDIVIGTHGIVISRGYKKGLLLPQVATEYKMDRNTFLSHTCLKAGLSQQAWKDPGTKIEIFTGIVFSEKDFGTFL